MMRCRLGWAIVALALGCSNEAANTPADSGVATDGAPTDGGVPPADAVADAIADAVVPLDGPTPLSKGWLYTQGNKVYVANGLGGGSVWVGRGVNMDDIFLCGYNNTLWMPNAGQALLTLATNLVATWKPTFVRVSLGMDSYPVQPSWTSNAAQYKTPMTAVIDSIGQNPGVYVLVSLRSDVSMVMEDTIHGDPEATGVPSNATDATYVALVDTFANSKFVLFGLSNEPGGNQVQTPVIVAAMDHAVGVIRAEENKLGVPHHIVSVQGNNWTSDISAYAAKPLVYDNVVYEVHGYPPQPSEYTFANLPVIIGEYGTLANAAAFFADVEAKQIPSLAWDFEPYSACNPDLLVVDQSSTNLTPTAWGSTVKGYLLAH